ncbi:quinoprotein dehydrogenase-associated SoxYZ-like carrier [Salipiger sp. P9]|uniref:quinoprotein dehydrogenase-associated SoxYZ-like carrier n=1 Tax=Salipiger pentaromativorans TaxID=2943193 RepID=UPI002158A0B4|nr:quinoprotein dehydrogenase-associated SoxYZ-like carrier [Salipiger pentaromativorans]MCR8548376.1 quinoprotein dehydrogenase-associated SoxYZ-like carrier [Salipiger pentaromativorans]
MRPALAALLILTALPAWAGEAWDSVRYQLYGDRAMLEGAGVIALDAPYRTANDARTRIAAQVAAPPGARIGKVSVVLDENPMPVSAVFTLKEPQQRFFFDTTLRINGPTPVHVVAEMSDGRLFVSEAFVKTSGQGACAAPPGTDPEAALATLGEMVLTVTGDVPGSAAERLAGLAARLKRLDVDISHPSHSGMQMDQITLLFLPMRYVERVEIQTDGGGYVEMTGSISLSENPQVSLSVPGATRSVDVTMTDISGTVTTAHKDLAGF